MAGPLDRLLHKGTGTKDWNASSLVLDALLSYAPDGTILPNLVTEVPTKENGGLSDDLTTVTINLQEGLLWSDGEPVTAEDVAFTWQWVTDPGQCLHQFLGLGSDCKYRGRF